MPFTIGIHVSKRATITIDTNCINTKQGMEHMNKMEKWHDQKLVEIMKTDVMDTEFSDAPSKFRRKSQKYKEDIGVGVFDHSRWGHAVFGGEGVNYPLEEMKKLLFPKFETLGKKAKKRAIRDAMHLATHYMHKRDFFVTEDKNFIEKRDKLTQRFGVTILTPKECVEKLEPSL